MRTITFWDTLWQDIRFGCRTLRRSPGYTAAAISVLALGIGANTAMFSVIRGVLLAPLPFPKGHELVLVQQAAPASNVDDAGVSIQELDDFRARLRSVRDLVEFHSMSFVLLNQGEPDRIAGGGRVRQLLRHARRAAAPRPHVPQGRRRHRRRGRARPEPATPGSRSSAARPASSAASCG